MDVRLAHLGEIIRRVRLQRGISQTQAAREAALSRNQLVAIENGSRNPSPEALTRISGVLGLLPRRMSELQVNLRQGSEYPAQWDALIPYLRGDVNDPPTSDWERQQLTDKLGGWLEQWSGADQSQPPLSGKSLPRPTGGSPRDIWALWSHAAQAATGLPEREGGRGVEQSVLRALLRHSFAPADSSEREERAALIDRLQTTLLALSTQDLAKVDAYIEGLLDQRWSVVTRPGEKPTISRK